MSATNCWMNERFCVWISSALLNYCVTISKELNLSEPQFLHLENGDNVSNNSCISQLCCNNNPQISWLVLINIYFLLSLHEGCSSPALGQTCLGFTYLFVPSPGLKKQPLSRLCCSHGGSRMKRASRRCSSKLSWELEHGPTCLYSICQSKSHGQAQSQWGEVV